MKTGGIAFCCALFAWVSIRASSAASRESGEIDMDSPAMIAGIQSGDVIIRIGETQISSYQELVKAFLFLEPEESVEIGLMRQGPDGYMEMEVSVSLGLKSE